MKKKSDETQQNEYEIIHEQIVSKKENRMHTILKRITHTILYAALFGLIAGCVFAATEKFLIRRWGVDGTLYQILSIGRPNTPAKNENEGWNTAGDDLSASENENNEIQRPQITISLGENINHDKSEFEPDKELLDIKEYYSGLTKLAQQAGNSLVRISAITEGVDWFEETYETQKNASGLYVGATDLELLFLVSLDSIEGATKLEVTLKNGKVVPGSIYSYDTNYRMAVIAVAMAALNGADQKYLPEEAEFIAGAISSGTPILILGTPNQHAGAIEVGMITGADGLVQITDDNVEYFTTNVTRYADGDGFVFSMDGKVLGIISDSLNNGENGVFSAASIEGISSEIDKLLGKKSRVYCGLHVETVSESVKNKYNVPNGVYITEVLTASPALSAGLKAGDIVVKVAGKSVKNVEEFHSALNSISGGKTYRITVSRETAGARREQEISVVLEFRAH